MESLQAYDVTLLPILIAIVAGLVKMGMSKKYAPVASVFLGIVVGIIYVAPHDPKEGILVGVALGLMAVGLHSGTKNAVETIKKE
ncbi:hypothetical protein [Cytobacillus kochii]|uniref:hypothetical protein n=1 Tax=Cytobacillus kochii TaxID=859143 RepID=UPI00402AFCF3